MREGPIIFGGERVRATLEDRKTMTRRTRGLECVNSYPGLLSGDSGGLGPLGYRGLEKTDYNLKPSAKKEFRKNPGIFHWFLGMSKDGRELNPIPVKCPYGQPGDRLWVKEALYSSLQSCGTRGYRRINYDADGTMVDPHKDWRWERNYLPSIFMPRWASRITLEITGIRVERVQDISESDAKAEGVDAWFPYTESLRQYAREGGSYRNGFHRLWNEINGGRGYGFELNPWVWVIEFARVA